MSNIWGARPLLPIFKEAQNVSPGCCAMWQKQELYFVPFCGSKTIEPQKGTSLGNQPYAFQTKYLVNLSVALCT